MPTRTLTLLLLVVAVSGCGPLTALKLVEDPAPLTQGAEDGLFTLSFNAGGFNVFLLGIEANLPGQPARRIRCRDVGPTSGDDYVLSCSEPGANLFDETTVGKPVRVSLVATKPEDRARTEYPLTELTWVPGN